MVGKHLKSKNSSKSKHSFRKFLKYSHNGYNQLQKSLLCEEVHHRLFFHEINGNSHISVVGIMVKRKRRSSFEIYYISKRLRT